MLHIILFMFLYKWAEYDKILRWWPTKLFLKYQWNRQRIAIKGIFILKRQQITIKRFFFSKMYQITVDQTEIHTGTVVVCFSCVFVSLCRLKGKLYFMIFATFVHTGITEKKILFLSMVNILDLLDYVIMPFNTGNIKKIRNWGEDRYWSVGMVSDICRPETWMHAISNTFHCHPVCHFKNSNWSPGSRH